MAHKIVFFNLEPWAKEYVAKSPKLAAAGVEVAFEDHILDAAHPAVDPTLDIAGIFVDSTMDSKTIQSLPNLKCIVALSTGFDHIDLSLAAARNITVSSVPSYGENTVAEFTFALILALSRKICDAHCRVREEGNFRLDGLRGFDLMGKTIGVLGTGRIGIHVVRMAKGFGMNVVAFDPYPNEALAKELGFSYLPLADLLAQSDIVTLHVPYMPATHHLINKDNIKIVKKGAYLINTSRGAIVETEALMAALEGGILGGAGLDVLEEEGVVKDELNSLVMGATEGHDLKTVLEDHALIDMPNVIVTPHNAFNTIEAFTRILDTTIDNVLGFVNGAPMNVVKQS
jgi:D-lactate dehydrogenase